MEEICTKHTIGDFWDDSSSPHSAPAILIQPVFHLATFCTMRSEIIPQQWCNHKHSQLPCLAFLGLSMSGVCFPPCQKTGKDWESWPMISERFFQSQSLNGFEHWRWKKNLLSLHCSSASFLRPCPATTRGQRWPRKNQTLDTGLRNRPNLHQE